MSEMTLGGYAAVFVFTLTFALVLTPLALRLAVHHRVFDEPSEIKAQATAVPYLGGVAIVVSFALVVIGAAALRPPLSGLDELALILGIGVALAVMGLVDDLRGLSPWVRLALELGAGVAIWATSNGAQVFSNGPLDLALTVVWVVVVTNAFNLLDNMDGLSAGVATIAAGSFFIIAALNGQFLVATLAIALAGCAAGFLRSNLHPASIYMGDAGSLFLGFLLAVIGLKLRFDGPTQVTFAVPILVVGVALFDTALVTVNRIAQGHSPMVGGRDHTSHRLLALGFPLKVAVRLNYLAAAGLGCLGLLVSRIDRVTAFTLLAWVLAVAVGLAIFLSRVPVTGPRGGGQRSPDAFRSETTTPTSSSEALT